MPQQAEHLNASPMSRVIQRVETAIMHNHLGAELAGEADAHPPMDKGRARRLAEEIVEELAPVGFERFPRLLQRHGLLFVVEEGIYLGAGHPDVLHISVWYGHRWIIVESVPLPPVQEASGN